MKLGLYLAGGLLLLLGGCLYLETRTEVGFTPLTGGPSHLLLKGLGAVAQIALLGFVIALSMIFRWWYPIPFLAVAAPLASAVAARVATAREFLAIACISGGLLVSLASLLVSI